MRCALLCVLLSVLLLELSNSNCGVRNAKDARERQDEKGQGAQRTDHFARAFALWRHSQCWAAVTQ